ALFGWKQLVANGSGLGVAAVDPGSGSGSTNDVSLYDVSDPRMTDRFLFEFPTPGTARAVSIYNGLAYVADGDSGMQVINYRAADTLGVPPAVAFTTSVAGPDVQEGSLILVEATVTDDVQVRNVELLVDGVSTQTDGNFPFQFFLRAPLASEASEVRIAVRASDTGGQRTVAPERVFRIVQDEFPPTVVSTVPSEASVLLDDFFESQALVVRFS